MAYVPCRACLKVNAFGADRCHVCGTAHPCSDEVQGGAPRRRRGPGLVFLLSLWPLLACGSGGGDPAARQRYEADKQRCASVSSDPAAQKSCMVYRGWPDGKFK